VCFNDDSERFCSPDVLVTRQDMDERLSPKRRRKETTLLLPASTTSLASLSRVAVPSETSHYLDLASARDTSGLESTTCSQTTRPQQKRSTSRSRLKSRWYTSMLGKLSSVAEVVDVIQGYKVEPPPFVLLLSSCVRKRLFFSRCCVLCPTRISVPGYYRIQLTDYADNELCYH
jgi:hypothetical protein